MRQIHKRLFRGLSLVLCIAVLLIGAAAVQAEEVDEATKKELVKTAQGLADTIISLPDEEIDAYIESGNEFTKNAITSWKAAKAELGEKSGDQDGAGETTVSFENNQYTIVYPVKFEKANADFVFIADKTETPTSMNVDVKLSMGTTIKRAALNTLMGLGTVFLMLIFLSFIISLFKFIPNGSKRKTVAADTPVVPARTAPAAAVQEENLTDDLELVAVITAAIAASQGTSPDGFVVRSIRKAKRIR